MPVGTQAEVVAPLPLRYGVMSRVGCAVIETYPDGVCITALIPRTRYWLRFAKCMMADGNGTSARMAVEHSHGAVASSLWVR